MLFSIGATAVSSPLAGAAADRFGPGLMAVAGGAVTTVGLLSMTGLGSDAGLGDIAWRLALFGLGQGLFHAPINATLLAAAPETMAGAAGGLSMTARATASTIGPAAAALAWALGSGRAGAGWDAAAGSASAIEGGIGGFHTGVAVLVALQVAGVVAVAAPHVAARHRCQTGTHSGTESGGGPSCIGVRHNLLPGCHMWICRRLARQIPTERLATYCADSPIGNPVSPDTY